jgi:hypothetical protein
MSEFQLDSIVKSIIDKFQSRAEMGWKKYGTTLDRQDLSPLDWIQHAQEEFMDGILYLEKLKRQFSDTGHLYQHLQTRQSHASDHSRAHETQLSAAASVPPQQPEPQANDSASRAQGQSE